MSGGEDRTDLGFDPTWTVHPGATIHDFMEENGFSLTVFASKLGVPPSTLEKVLSGEWPITSDLSKMLEFETGASSEFWLNREENFRQDLLARRRWVRRLERKVDNG